jgi:hypothetical protein
MYNDSLGIFVFDDRSTMRCFLLIAYHCSSTVSGGFYIGHDDIPLIRRCQSYLRVNNVLLRG